jgi:hypothetical protein
MDKNKIIDELKRLCSYSNINLGTEKYVSEYIPINDFISYFNHKSKPESAAVDLMKHLIKDVLEYKAVTEANIDTGFIDFIISSEGKGNPIYIEMKPFFRLSTDGATILKHDMNYKNNEKQVKKYLTQKQVEYVILTNIDKAYIFNRNALIEFTPFYETTFIEILENYLNNDNVWDIIRRYEDNYSPVSLDSDFFKSLKDWFASFDNVKFIPDERFTREELIVLFLNKFIFIKTLEDYGLIPYKYIQDKYNKSIKDWKPKGYQKVFDDFFYNIEEFFSIYYDTELFETNIWEYLIPEENNVRQFKSAFEQILGMNEWSQTFGRGLVHYNYRQINEDIFGKAYETWIAENRKDEGIYYTPASITEYMADKLVDTLFDELTAELITELKKPVHDDEKINGLVDRISKIKIIDSSSGSGSFLIKVLRRIYIKYLEIIKSTEWVEDFIAKDTQSMPENYIYIENFRKKMDFNKNSGLKLISRIILNHIFAADKDERAIDTAKANIWKEAIKLNPAIYNFKRLGEDIEHILPNMELNFIKGDSLTDTYFDEQIEIISKEYINDIKVLFDIRKSYLENPYNHDSIKKVPEIKEKIRNRLKENHQFKDSIFFPLEYFFCFFTSDGKPLPKEEQGFDGIISNPPWEAIKPIKKEFAKQGKYGMDVLNFNKWFDNELKEKPEFKVNWENYVLEYSKYTEYLYSKYKKQSSGDPNFYKFFMERDFQLIKSKGYYCLLVPSGFQTDEGSNKLRNLLIEDFHLLELYSFENRGYQENENDHKVKLFPEVDNRFKFSIVLSKKENLNGEKHSFKAKFYLHHPKDLYNGNTITYNIEKIKEFSPENLSIMEFRSEKDYELCQKIRGEYKLFGDLKYEFRREFEISSNEIYVTKDSKDKELIKLIEGKTIHQFNSNYGIPRFKVKKEYIEVIKKKEINKIAKVIDKSFNPDDYKNIILNSEYDCYRLIYRRVGRSTDQRTLISSIAPPKRIMADSLNYLQSLYYSSPNGKDIIQSRIDYRNLVLLMSVFNSLTINYYIRNKVSANLSLFFIYELPISEADEDQQKRIVNLGFSLLYRKSNKADFADLKKELGIEPDMRDLNEIRAELEVIIAKHLYNLDKSDWEYLTSTFTYGADSDTKKELDEFIRLSHEMWDGI